MRISDWSSDVCSSDLDLADIHVDAADADGMPCRIQHREVGDHAEHLFAVEPRDLHLGFHRDTGAQHGAVLGDDHLCLLGWEMVAGGGANNLPSLQSVELEDLLVGEQMNPMLVLQHQAGEIGRASCRE